MRQPLTTPESNFTDASMEHTLSLKTTFYNNRNREPECCRAKAQHGKRATSCLDHLG
jgi:hypothetical protein